MTKFRFLFESDFISQKITFEIINFFKTKIIKFNIYV